MRIRSLLPSAFGKFHMDEPIILEDGLNMVRGENEAGKSTLGAFILGMLYGFKKDGKTRISRLPEFDRYRPWSGSDYRGSMTYEEGGRVYRVERSFDPDAVRILDDTTGENLTRQFSQDSRKEYDFALRHLGLSQKEFRNTIWIGQLGSAQEPGLGTEIQGKLESILEGGAEDVSLARALSALADEKAKLKQPRSTKAKLDLIAQEIDRLEKELAAAQAREEQVRDWLIEASHLAREKARLEKEVDRGLRGLREGRYRLLRGILSSASELETQSAAQQERMRSLEWARDLPAGAKESYEALRREQEAIGKRITEIEAEILAITQKRDAALESLAEYEKVESAKVDEAGVSALHSKFMMTKAQATQGERRANEARRELRLLEQEGKDKGYPIEDLDEDILRRAEDYQQNCLLAEKEKDRLEVEVERARATVSSVGATGGTTLFFASALVMLGLAVVCTVMGLPISIPLFIVATVIFVFGVSRHRQTAKQRLSAQKALEDKEREVLAQTERIENVRKILSEFLATIGTRSVEELRTRAREIASYRARLAAAVERFDQVQKAWFESSAELSAVEKELLDLLRSTGTIKATDPVSDGAVTSLRKRLREAMSYRAEVRSLESRLEEIKAARDQQEALLQTSNEREMQLLQAAGAASGEELQEKIAALEEYQEAARLVSEAAARSSALLTGRDISEVRAEIDRLTLEMGDSQIPDEPITDHEYEEMRQAHDRDRSALAEINQRLAGLERGIRLRGEEGRPAALIEEELERQRALEEELSLHREALELAHETLSELSAGIRREFAPALNNRVGAILSRITEGRYSQAKVSPDLEVSVIHPETRGQTGIASLSAGTLDQCYFALRVAIAEAITKKECFPFFFDDSFVQYDDRRLEGVLHLLAELSKTHQILVFSCHGREEEMAGRMGIRYHKVALQ
ncbi:MAG: AAA family ATPase [Bacillota bacterium]